MITLMPAIVGRQLPTNGSILTSTNLSFVMLKEVTFGRNMGEKMGNIAEFWLFGADVAKEWNGSHGSN